LLHTKILICTCLACLLLAGPTGCGSGGESTAAPEGPGKGLARWFKGVEAAVARMEQKQRGFTQFAVAQPPPKGDLAKLSPAGSKAGETAAGAAAQLDAATTLSGEEAAGLYCYFFAFYANLESSPDEGEFEVVIANLVKAKLSASSSAAAVGDSADLLREAMIEAEKAGGRAPEVAAAAFC
jgi:hypothetical protein